MDDLFDRRRVLRASFAVATASTIGVLSAPSARAGSARSPFPPVPGMLGDRRANELWFQFEETTWYNPDPEFKDAIAAVKAYLGPDAEVKLAQTWMDFRKSGDYPRNYVEFVRPMKAALQVISRTELGVFDQFYRHDPQGLTAAFADFGQGVLFDPRMQGTNKVHSMNGAPPVGYHIWHAFLRAKVYLGIDVQQWRRLDPVMGFAWSLQSIAKPSQTAVNPPLSRQVVREQARAWLPLSESQLDQAFLSYPYPAAG